MSLTPFDPADEGWAMMEEAGFARTIGPFWTKRDGDSVLFGLLTHEGHANRSGRIHGGVMLALSDHAMGHTSVAAGQGALQATLQLDTQFVAAPDVGDFLVARGSVTRMARSVVFLRAEISSGGRLVATATGIWKIINGGQPVGR